MNRAALFAFVGVISCAQATTVSAPQPTGPTKPPRPGSAYPGFDKRDFPGLSQMQTWWRTSPYEWVGYYLPSPCYSGAAWTGNRQQLTDQGWGLALLYVGLQAPRAAPSTATAPTRCSTNALSTEQGRVDADDAVNVAAADGFPEGTVIFLDVERAEPYPEELDAYVRAWVARVLQRKFTPGIYAHRINANTLFNAARAAYRGANDLRDPPFWISNSQGFDLTRSPAESGFPFATIWQNPIDANETHGGVTFRIDSNVSSKRSPSQQ